MGLIEDAARRLQELKEAGYASKPAAAPAPVKHPDPHGTSAPATSPDRYQRVQGPSVAIDLKRLADAGFLTPSAPRSQIAEEYRVIKRPLIENAARGRDSSIARPNLVMVTSAMPGEGKTFTALNFAMSVAMDLDHPVLLVDADLARPALPDILGIPRQRGFLDLLREPGLDPSGVIATTNLARLSFLSSGQDHPNAADMLASAALPRLLDQLRDRYAGGIVVFDSPPLLVTTEARLLAAQMGQILFVVREGRTLQSQLRQALAIIEACPVKLMMMNAATGGAQGGYGYVYGRGE